MAVPTKSKSTIKRSAIDIILPERPTRLAKKATDYVMMFFGPPGVGKTTFVDEMTEQRTLFISTDRGTRFRNMMRIECHSWKQIEGTIDKLEKNPTKAKQLYDAVCIDHVDDAVGLLEDHICDELGVMSLGDAGYGKGWKAFKQGIQRTLVQRIMKIGLGVIFICHEDIKTIETRTAKLERTMPKLSKMPAGIILPIADIIGYCGFRTVKVADGKRKEIRTIETDPREDLYAKDRTDRAKPEKGYEKLDGKAFVATFKKD